jgi:hypothetical protein
LRPESIKVLAREGRESEGVVDIRPVVTLVEPHGHESHLVAKVSKQQIILRSANPKRLAIMEAARPGDALPSTLDRTALHWFQAGGTGTRVTINPDRIETRELGSPL